MNRHIAVFTGSRADYGVLRPVLEILKQEHGCCLSILVGGAHLSDAYGGTVAEIREDGFHPAACVDMQLGDDSPPEICRAIGLAVQGIGEALTALHPDILVVLGDRYEMLAAALAANICGIPVAHISGGDVTQGAMDDSFRHAITKLSHLHFTDTASHRRRVIQLGENPQNVFHVGALGVENVLKVRLMKETAIRDILFLSHQARYILCTMHPLTLDAGSEQDNINVIFEALSEFKEYIMVFTGANADSGGRIINQYLAKRALADSRVRFILSLGTVRYLSAAKYASCVLGNSSSGVVELPSLGVPILDIGDRQKGRERSKSVLHSDNTVYSIKNALRIALSKGYRDSIMNTSNPYEKSETAKNIAKHLLTYQLKGILKKNFYNLPEECFPTIRI